MFENLTERMRTVFDKLKGRGVLSEADVLSGLREIRIALLEADVALPVVKTFIDQVKEKAVGQDVLKNINPGQMLIKIVHDHLVEVLGTEGGSFSFQAQAPVVYLMAGLQGSGKTTMSAKIAHYLSTREKKKVFLASTDVYRPAAREQLKRLGDQLKIDVLPIIDQELPLDITHRAMREAKLGGYDILIIDTAGRLHVDESLMDEIQRIKKVSAPTETLLVADALTGQDAVSIASTFHEQLGLTGICLSRIDGDGRGGAALSMRVMTGCPLKMLGVGEKPEAWELFSAERLAGRILDKGDVVSFVEKIASTLDQEEAAKAAERMQKGLFTLDDFSSQLKQMKKMGGVSSLLSALPGMGKIKEQLKDKNIDENLIGRQMAILSSMTPRERKNPKILNGSRRKRIAQGSGTSVQDVNKLLKQFQEMSLVMKRLGAWGQKGLMRQGLQGLFQR